MADLFIKGGPVMFLLLMCSVAGLYIVIQKLLFLQSHRIKTQLFIDKVKHHLLTNGKEQVLKDLRTDRKIMVKAVVAAITLSNLERSEIKESSQEIMGPEVAKLEKNITLVSSIITVAPILGLLGTVLGLMDMFNVISGGQIENSLTLSSGISKALLTTVAGLSIAIPFIFLKSYLSYRIESFITEMERLIMDMAFYCKNNQGVKP